MIEIKETINIEKWDKLVKEKGTKIEEFSDYSKIMEEDGWKARYIVLDEYKAGLVFYEKKTKVLKIKALPPMGSEEDSASLIEVLKKQMKRAWFYNYIMPDRYISILKDMKGFYKNSFSTIEIPLKEDLNKIWANLDKEARWGVNRARKEGAEIIEASNEKDVEIFYNIYKETCERGGIVPVSLDFMKYLFNHFREYNALFLVKYKEKYIAGSWVKMSANFSLPKQEYNASLSEFLDVQPNNLLYWHMIEWAKRRGCSGFDLGGIEPDAKEGSKLSQLNRFKERWGGERRDYFIYSTSFFYNWLSNQMKKDGLISKLINRLRS